MHEALQSIDGRLVPVVEVCIEHALKTFMERRLQDAKPVIVRMVLRGHEIKHWYYKSEQWIDQPYSIHAMGLQPYVGPASGAPAEFYGPGTFFVEDNLIQFVASVPNEVVREFMKQSGMPHG